MRQLKDCFRKWTSQQKRILDPGGNIALTWNRIFLVSCVASYCVDPLFFFLLTVDGTNPCMRIDRHLAIVLTYLRTIVDMFFIVNIATRLCTAYVDPVSKVLGKGELVTDPKRIAHRYIRTNFIDLVAALLSTNAAPSSHMQILVWAALPSLSFKYVGAPLFLIILVQSDDLRIRISRFLECKWIATQGIEEDSILKQLPVDLRQDIKQYLCLDLVQRVSGFLVTANMFCYNSNNLFYFKFKRKKRNITDEQQTAIVNYEMNQKYVLQFKFQVPLFSVMDQQLLNAICERMTYFLRTEGTYIIREGDPVKVMLFIIRGKLESSTTDGGRTGFFNSIILKPGDFCGEELLTWALLPRSSESYPSSTRTVRTIAEFEAFSLQADDIKFVASTFRMMHSKHLQHILRFYSNQWRTWAACFIQSAWRRHRNRQKMAEGGLSSRWKSFFSLIDNHANEARHQNNDGSSSSTPQGAEFPFSKIATIFLKAQKDRPMESDFSMDDHSE